LKQEIKEGMQHGFLNATKNCQFGKFEREIFDFYWDYEDKRKVKFNRYKRLVKGSKKREIIFKVTLTGDELNYWLGNDYYNFEYEDFGTKFYDKLEGVYELHNYQYWKMRMRELTLKYNYSRQRMVYDTVWDRWGRNDPNSNWIVKA
jgi:hypothetical protein